MQHALGTGTQSIQRMNRWSKNENPGQSVQSTPEKRHHPDQIGGDEPREHIDQDASRRDGRVLTTFETNKAEIYMKPVNTIQELTRP